MVQSTVVWRIAKGTHWPLLDHRSTRLRAGALPELRGSLLRIRIRRLQLSPPLGVGPQRRIAMCPLPYGMLSHIVRLSAIVINMKICCHAGRTTSKHPCVTARSRVKKVGDNQCKRPNLIET